MARKPLAPGEQLVGRRLPPYPKHIDTVLSMFVSNREFKSRLPPHEDYLKSAFRQARKNGWLRATKLAISFMGSRPESYWELTEKGKQEALVADERVQKRIEERRQWNVDWNAARKKVLNPEL